jgi:hypothetical protein
MHGTRPSPLHPTYSHLLADGRPNIPQIHALAVTAAKRWDVYQSRPGSSTPLVERRRYPASLRANLRNEWMRANLQRGSYLAKLMPADFIAAALFGADMIDETAASNAARAAILSGGR